MSIAIVVIEGEGAVNIIQQETSVAVLKYGGGSSQFHISMTGVSGADNNPLIECGGCQLGTGPSPPTYRFSKSSSRRI